MRIGLIAAAINLAIGLAIADPASAAIRKHTDIPPQPLGPALQQLMKERELHLVYISEDVRNQHTPGAVGDLTIEEALTKLLAGTNLVYRYLDDNSITIVPQASGETSSLLPGQGSTIHVARLEEGRGEVAAAEVGTEARPQQRIELEEITVTGSRLRRGEGEEPSPVVVFDRKKIEALGASSVPDILKYSTQQPFVSAETNGISGQQFTQFRGLPVGTTAVLINGRRTIVSASEQNSNGLNLNMIPLAAVERIEILADSGSAMYGADAVGGVMNVILRNDISRPVVELRYGGASGGADERRASLTTGLAGDRFRTSLLADYFERDPLLGAQRDRWANQDYRRFGGIDRRQASANPGAIVSATSANLTGLPSRFALVRPGSSGVGLTPADFISVPTQADLNTESVRRYEQIVLDQRRRSAAGLAELDLFDTTTLFMEAFYSDSTVIDRFKPPTSSPTSPLNVPANNPFNPFNQALSVQYLFEGVGPGYSIFEQDLYNATAGMKARWGSWDWELSAQFARSTSLTQQNINTNVSTAQANCLLTNPASRAPGACNGISEVLNVFQDGPGGSAALLASLVAAPTVTEGDTRARQVATFLRGDVVDLPAGAVEMVIGGSAGTEKNSLVQLAPAIVSIPGDRRTSAAFTEVRIPLIAQSMQIPALRALSLKLAGRYDHYSDFGDTFNPQYGLVWSPTADLSLTASYGTSFSPPSLFNLFRPQLTTNRSVRDPLRNENVTVPVFSGGNPELDPEEGTSFISGIVLAPHGLPTLRLSAHYWRVVLDDHVDAYSVDQILSNPQLFGSRIVRGAALATDPPGTPGPLRSVDITAVNFARAETSGIDLAAAYSVDTKWGRFSPSAAATWTDYYKATDSPTLPTEQRVGMITGSGTIPKWKGVGTLAWEKQGLRLSMTARYTHRYADTAFVGGLSVPTGREIPSQTLFDMQASIDWDDFSRVDSWLVEKLKISIGVSNLFDKEPPFVDAASSAGYDFYQGNLIGRWAYINLSKGL